MTRQSREACAKAHPYWVSAMVCAFAFGMALVSLEANGKVDDRGLGSVLVALSVCSVIGFAVLGAMLKRWASQ